jgi:D-3-phosphoglycerate dehydrogenase
VQTLSVEKLKQLAPLHDGWIIGDDPATREVFSAGKAGKLKAAVKWGVGVDNVDFSACKEFNIAIINTPNMFGREVADIAFGYVVALARETFEIDRAVRLGEWIKPSGISLFDKKVALVGFGDIGRQTAERLLAADMQVMVYDPYAKNSTECSNVEIVSWPDRIEEADFIVVTCSLTPSSSQMLNSDIFSRVKRGVRVVNVGRGGVIDENALEEALKSGQVYSAALDVFETEPLPLGSYLLSHPHCVFGSHNSSNTVDAVKRTSYVAIQQLFDFLGIG